MCEYLFFFYLFAKCFQLCMTFLTAWLRESDIILRKIDKQEAAELKEQAVGSAQ